MFNPQFFYIAFYIFLALPIIVFSILIFTKLSAPYGRLSSAAWGSAMIPAKIGWLIMESPSSIIFMIFIATSNSVNSGTIALFIIWQIHYFYRSFIYPFSSTHSKPMPLTVVLSALSFQLINTYFQAGWIYVIAPADMYAGDYLMSWQFILGGIVFFTGTLINRQSDSILKNIRKPGETGYKIPYGGLYKWVSCPNYLGEIIIWLGWTIMLNSIIGFAFFIWTISNLAPRALQNHKWYLANFDDYPKDRKALLPFIV